jgi:long-chain acyl-CoA synthetase
MLSHTNVMAAIVTLQTFIAHVNMGLDHTDVYLSFLPLAHIFDRQGTQLRARRASTLRAWPADC